MHALEREPVSHSSLYYNEESRVFVFPSGHAKHMLILEVLEITIQKK